MTSRLRAPSARWGVLATAGLAVGLVIGAAALWRAAPAPDVLRFSPPAAPAVVLLTADGEPFARRGALKAAPVDVRALPPHVAEAFVAIEDRRFYRHHGVDPRGVLRAAAVDLRAGSVVEGGSTITQQLVKNAALSPRQTLGRKVREAVGALKLERKLTKDQILSAYLNTAYFGNGAYGLGAAATTYFDKPPEALSLGEAAMLAGMVKAPSQLALRRRLPEAQARERLVLQAMVRARYITPAEAASAESATPVDPSGPADFGGYFADWVYPSVARGLAPAYGAVQVRTTLDGALQRQAENVVRHALDAHGEAGRASQAALVAMHTDGRVVAMVGGRAYRASTFNRAAQARRQVGSTFKLFTYLTAFQQGADPESLVSDEPLQIGNWRPTNADHENHGVLTMEDAFSRSSNLAAIRVAQAVGIPAVIRTAHALGITSDLQPVPSLTLGASEVNLLELTSAYASVAAGAYPVRPKGAPSEGVRAPQGVMDETVRSNMLRLLRLAVLRGGGAAAELPLTVYGKTGTSQNYRDALFVGFAGDLVVGVWVGNDDERPMNGVYGGALPARIFADFMREALGGQIQAEREPDRWRNAEPEQPRGLLGELGRLFGL